MNINIYYGGRGLIEDPTLYVVSKIEAILDELHVHINRYNLYEMKNSISTMPQTLKDADGIILACHLEWHGIGGYMQEFLDSCWLYGDKEKISKLYMAPIVVSSTFGEQDSYLYLKQAWELLGGLPCEGIRTYVEDNVDFEINKTYAAIIEKVAENIYRTVSHKIKTLPTSCYVIKETILPDTLELTPQESEQLSKYASDDIYVKKQKEDIEELTNMFKGMLGEQGESSESEFLKDFHNHFKPDNSLQASYLFMIEDRDQPLYLNIDKDSLECRYEDHDNVDVLIKLKHEILNNIISGRVTFQRAFMTGDLTSKGNFKTFRMLDQIFEF